MQGRVGQGRVGQGRADANSCELDANSHKSENCGTGGANDLAMTKDTSPPHPQSAALALAF